MPGQNDSVHCAEHVQCTLYIWAVDFVHNKWWLIHIQIVVFYSFNFFSKTN